MLKDVAVNSLMKCIAMHCEGVVHFIYTLSSKKAQGDFPAGFMDKYLYFFLSTRLSLFHSESVDHFGYCGHCKDDQILRPMSLGSVSLSLCLLQFLPAVFCSFSITGLSPSSISL